jgi:hypothetical protein
MSFRRYGKLAHLQSQSWQAWLDSNADLLKRCELPLSVLSNQDDWNYLLRYGYHCRGAYPDIDFRLEELSEAQKEAFRELLERTLSAEEKRRGSAGWHFACPPGAPEPRVE